MKTSNQKYRNRHWWKFTDWDSVVMVAIVVALFVGMLFGIGWVIAHSNNDDSDKADSITDSVQLDSVAVDSMPDSTMIVDSVPTKSDPAVFDTTIESTRIVIKTNRNIKVTVK